MVVEQQMVTVIETILKSELTWGILCLILAVVFYRKMDSNTKELKDENSRREQQIIQMYEVHKQEARQREERLMSHLERTTDTLEKMEKNLQKLDEKMDRGFKEVWDHVRHPEPWRSN